jgi:hypothetical protein
MDIEPAKKALVRRAERLAHGERAADAAPSFDLAETVRLQGLLLEQMGLEMDLLVEIVMTMDRKFEWLAEEADGRFGESECRFEALFEEVHDLQRRIGGFRPRRVRVRRLGDPPPV